MEEERLLQKAKEAFIMGLEIYNKPTLKYRVEGFSFFICNAWELMLKSYIIKKFGEKSIYFSDNQNRTIALENCIRKVFTNDKDPLRINLEKIIELRNTSTHFVTEEYEIFYAPLFQACVFNFCNKLKLFHNEDISDLVPKHFLYLATDIQILEYEKIKAKYSEEVAEKIFKLNDNINNISANCSSNNFSIKIEHQHYLTKDETTANSKVCITKDSDTNVTIIKEIQDPNNTHNFTAKKCVERIKMSLENSHIELETPFTMNTFNLFCKFYEIKNDKKFCFINRINKNPVYSYSIHVINFIVEEIKKDPEHIIQNLKNNIKKNQS